MTSTTLGQWLQAILAHFTTHFAKQGQQVPTISTAIPEGDQSLITPALLLECEAGHLGQPTSDGHHQVQLRLTLHCVLSLQTPDVVSAMRDFATQVMLQVADNQWGCRNVSVPSQLEMGPGQFRQGDKGYDTWYVTWEQGIALEQYLWQTTTYQGPLEISLVEAKQAPST